MLLFGEGHIYGRLKEDLKSHVDVRILFESAFEEFLDLPYVGVALTKAHDRCRHAGSYWKWKHDFSMVDQ
jgi:hypothetical protein